MIKDLLTMEGHVHDYFMVKSATRAINNNGSPYLSLVLQDVSGTIDAKMWQVTDDEVDLASPGNIIEIEGSVLTFKGHPQIKITDILSVSTGNIDKSKFVPNAPINFSLLEQELIKFINMIEDNELKNLVKTVIDERKECFLDYPAAVTVHHAYLHGLLFHSVTICKMALEVQKEYSFLQKDYLIAGALLHDIGKTVELQSDIAPGYTDEGNLLGHINIGCNIVSECGKKLHISNEKLNVILHMILSHHGSPEFGSPKIPMIAEAYVLHCLDDLDAKMECLRTTLESTSEGSFTNNIVWLGNTKFFKPHKLDDNK